MKSKFKQICYLLFAVSLLLSLFYLRLLPRVSRDLWQHMTYSQILVTLFSIVLLLIHIYSILKLLGFLSEKPTNYFNKVYRWLLKLQKFIIDILYNFYLFCWHITELLVKRLTKRKHFIHYSVIGLLAKRFNKKSMFKYYCWLLIGIKYIPKILFVTAFFIDVIIYKRLDYTFKFLPVLLIPLLEKLIIFMFQEFYDTHNEGVSSFVEKKPIVDSELMDYSFIPEYQQIPPPFFKDFNDFFFNHYVVIQELRENLEFYNFWQYKIFPAYLLDFILLFLRLLLFIYILIYGLS